MSIIKTGLFIEGVEVTSEHIGKKLEVLESSSEHWLPVGFITVIEGVYDSGAISLQDTGGAGSSYEIGITDAELWVFKWTTPPKPKKSSTKPQRQKLAKAIKEAKATLDLAIQDAGEFGMIVDISKDNVKITFNPPTEEY